ncbi:MAG: electron transport complex subunit RsxE [Pirellulaceae bacterium]|nr:electron transport complex subunit RsxE [Pirellulaceae bacterium]
MNTPASLPGAGQRFTQGLLPENPVFRQLLGMCPTLAVTNSVAGALTMGLATGLVLVSSNLITSLLRRQLQPHLRILVYTLTIASLVTIADRFLAAFLPEMSRLLGPYVPLIIVNCLIISRAEVCASKQGPWVALWDGLGQGGGFLLGLLAMGTVRELLGAGSLLGWRVLPAAWENWVIMVLPAGGFLTLGALIAVVNWYVQRREQARGSEPDHG